MELVYSYWRDNHFSSSGLINIDSTFVYLPIKLWIDSFNKATFRGALQFPDNMELRLRKAFWANILVGLFNA